MPAGIAEIVPVLCVGAVAILAGIHAISAWCSYELDLHNVRTEARRLHAQMERRRDMLLDDAEVEDLGQMPDAA